MRLKPSLICLCVLCFIVVEARGAKKIVVAADGSGDFRTVQQALDHVPENNNQPVVIQIKPGIYNEQIRVAAGKTHITLRGEDPAKTVLTYKLSALQAGNTRLAFSTLINGDDFRAENITFENTFGTGSQAVALFVDAARASFENCRFLAWQDTLFVNGSRHYFKNCYIEGHVDFIFGTASAVFEDCTIHSKGQGYVTAHYRLSNEESTGFVFLRCRLTGQDTGNGVYLGRPWRPYARVVFIDCWLGPHIRPEGWDNWRDPAREKTAWFGEYRSKGPGANPKARVVWSRQLTGDEAATFSRSRFFSGPVRGLQGKANQAVGTIAWIDAQNKPDEWYASYEALRIADNVLLYQRDSGGWPKNIDMGKPYDESERPTLIAQKKEKDSTIDNGATYTQLSFLARVYTKQPQERLRESFLRGFDYLLQAPNLSDYYKHITDNDDAMIGVMKLLRDVAAAKPNYAFVDEARRARAAVAVEKGIDCILKTQVESVGVVRFLMSINDPSPAVVDAINSAIAWFKGVVAQDPNVEEPAKLLKDEYPKWRDRIAKMKHD